MAVVAPIVPVAKPPPHGPSTIQRPLHTQPATRRLVWTLTLVGHGIAIAATVSFLKLHAFIQASARLQVDIQQIGTHLLDYFDYVKAACVATATVHALVLLYAMKVSLIGVRTFALDDEKALADERRTPCSCWRQAHVSLARALTTYNSELTLLRLLIEVVMQTYQANKMSNLVASVSLNRVLILVVVVNCWFTPLIHTLMRQRSQHERRVIRLAVDTALDVVYSFGIPCVIMFPYWRDFDPAVGSFPFYFYIMDTWTTVTGSELQQLFITSWWDFISKVTPWFTFCYRLHVVRRLAHRREEQHSGVDSNSRRTTMARFLNNVLLVWGLGVLCIHLHVTYVANTASTVGCLVEMRPWLATSYTCIVVELSCSQRGILGTKPETLAAIDDFTPGRVQSLIVSHCPSFEMPSIILTFSSLAMFKFYNSTIADWGQDATITAATNPIVQQFFAINTNFTAFPEGLLSLEMPKTMRDVKFVGTNLTTLPPALATAWRSTKYFTVERSLAMTEFPEALAEMPETIYTGFMYNGLDHLSEASLQKLNVIFFSVEGNPLRTLPEGIGNMENIYFFNVKRTNIESLPASWDQLQRDSTVQFIADGSPLCAKLQGDQANPSPHFVLGKIDVVCNDTVFVDSSYPVHLEREWRERNRYPKT